MKCCYVNIAFYCSALFRERRIGNTKNTSGLFDVPVFEILTGFHSHAVDDFFFRSYFNGLVGVKLNTLSVSIPV
jgi:hypothetical protein